MDNKNWIQYFFVEMVENFYETYHKYIKIKGKFKNIYIRVAYIFLKCQSIWTSINPELFCEECTKF